MTDQSISFSDFQDILKSLELLDPTQRILALDTLRKSKSLDRDLSIRIEVKAPEVARTQAIKVIQNHEIDDPNGEVAWALAEVVSKEAHFWAEPYFLRGDDQELNYWIEHTLNWYIYNKQLSMFVPAGVPRDAEADRVSTIDRKLRLSL